ncbi:restriction endonuclease subunit S [Helicobacter pylori]|uniref:restriction endonuclease subunit S n=1 Tax=Helicobacter pylori TaxID=210 RepID=UPI0002BA57A9|nr:restriction endonuclease subunit S [Helicobacter pylori]EMH32448.1 type I restriction modification DNA specificity domain protein [Helicobacter pylori GAM42Ai]
MDAFTTPLPKAWQKVRLGDICEFGNGGAYETLIVENGNFKLISLNSIDIDGNLKNTMKRVNFYDNSLKQDDIVMVLSDVAHGDFLGLCAVIPNNDYVLNQRMGRLRKKNDCINILFLRLYINANQKYFKMQGQGSSQLNLSKKAIEDFEILLPPLNEQAAIANVLSDVDHYLCSLDALILKKESVKKALSFELLSQRKRLKGFNQAWQRVRLGDIAEIKRGASPRPIENPKWFCANSNVGWVRISDISKNSRFLYKTAQKLSKKGIEKSRFVKQNSLIMSMCATIGKPIITKIDTCIHDGFVVFENPRIDLNYLYYFLCYIEKEWLESGQQGSQVNLNVDLIKNKEVFCPKDLNEQIAIANILSGLDSEIISLKNKKRQFENIKKALNHDLMSAKIRVLKK